MSNGPTEPAPRGRLAHQPALDGIRALAVLAVMLFHGGVARAQGGFIGVDVFLVLSGFLITTLLFRELESTGRVAFRDFWLRRARRLLPALFLVLVAVGLFGAFVATDDEALGLRGDLFGSLFYVQNWRLVFAGQSYFAQFGAPSPLRHMWSLAIEEQWYVIWPLLFFGIVKVARRNTKVVAAITLALAGASALLMVWLYEPGTDVSRVYYGTDTRAQALLIGAALAIVFSGGDLLARRATAVVSQVLGAVGLVFLVWVTVERSESWTRFYQGGFSMVAVAAAAVIAAAMTRGPVRRVLALAPLPAIGLISYGLYLWHWPLYVLLSPARTGLEGTGLLLLRLAVTFAVAIGSFVLVERPIREQRLSWIRGRALWIPIASATTAVMLLALTATGPASRPREGIEAINAAFAQAGGYEKSNPAATTVLIAGDSVSFTLGFAGPPASLRTKLDLPAVARLGCGLLGGTLLEGDRRGDSQEGCADWPKTYAQGVERTRPEVAMLLLGAWEVIDRTIDGRDYRVGTPQLEGLLRDELDRARRILTADGARLVLLTTPCFSPVERDLGAFGEEARADPSRVRWINGVWRRWVADHPDVTLLDLDALACPGGKYAATIRGVDMRTDGVHFSTDGAHLVWRWLGPQLIRIAKQPA